MGFTYRQALNKARVLVRQTRKIHFVMEKDGSYAAVSIDKAAEVSRQGWKRKDAVR